MERDRPGDEPGSLHTPAEAQRRARRPRRTDTAGRGESGVPLADAEVILYMQKLRKRTKEHMRLSWLRPYLENPNSQYHSMTEWLLGTSDIMPKPPPPTHLLSDETTRKLNRKYTKSVRAIVRAWRRKGLV